jgi:aryl-alcohol dehydrogenase-like predicted oxidoreductase
MNRITRRDFTKTALTTGGLRESVRRLQTGTVDLMQVHNLRDWQKNIPLLQELKKDGRFRYIGLTTSRASQYEEMEKAMLRHDLDFIQINYSPEQREAVQRLLPLAADASLTRYSYFARSMASTIIRFASSEPCQSPMRTHFPGSRSL